MTSTPTTPTPTTPVRTLSRTSKELPKTSLEKPDSHNTSERSSDASHAPSSSTAPIGGLKAVGIVAACTLSMMMNIAIGNPAITLTSVGQEFGETEASTQWTLNAYAISAACFLLLSGRLADLYGRKRVWMIGFATLAIFDIGCGFANNSTTLYVLRGFQGLGGAAVVPASLGILAHSFPPSRARSLAFATFSAGAPLGGAIGFMLGAVVTQLSKPTWRTLYFVTAGISVLGLLLGIFCIERDLPSQEKDRRVDWIGAFLVTSGLVLIVFVLSDSPSVAKGWKTPYIIALLVVGVILLIAFSFWQHFLEKRSETSSVSRSWWEAPPLMRLSLWTRAKGRFSVMQLIACLNWAAFTCWLVWVQLYYQNYLELTPILTMVRILPLTFVGIAANAVIALIIGRVDVQIIVTIGTILTGVAVLLFAIIDPEMPYWAYGFPSALIIVLGADFVFASGTLFIAKITLPHEQSVAGAVFQAMTQIGTAIGLSISTIVFNKVIENGAKTAGVVLNTNRDNVPKDVLLKGYHDAMWTGFAFSMLCASLSIFLRGVGVVGHPPDKKPDASAEANQDTTPVQSPIEREEKTPVEDHTNSAGTSAHVHSHEKSVGA